MMAQNALQGSAASPAELATMNAAIASILRAEGLDPAAVSKRAASPEIAGQISDVKSLAAALKIDGTPTFVFGDRLLVLTV
jgi:protein-disulfide isomerase